MVVASARLCYGSALGSFLVAVAIGKNAKKFLRDVLERKVQAVAQLELSNRDSEIIGSASRIGLGKAGQVRSVRHGWRRRAKQKLKVK